MFVSGDLGNAAESGIAVRDNMDGTYTTLWTGGPISKNWKGSGLLSPDGTKILHSTYADAGAQSAWVLDITDGHVVSSARDVNSYPRPALSPDGNTFYVAGTDVGGGGGALAAYELDVNGCLSKKWQVNGMGGEVTGADRHQRLRLLRQQRRTGLGHPGQRNSRHDRARFGGAARAHVLVRRGDAGGRRRGRVRLRRRQLPAWASIPPDPNPNTRTVFAFNPVPLSSAESGAPRITSITRGSIELAWEKAGPSIYRVWRGDDVTGPFSPISDVLLLESFADDAPPADQAFYKVEWIPTNPEVQVEFYDFESGDQGWTHSGAVDDWERGEPVDHTGDGTAPNGAHSGSNAWATKLAADYSSDSMSILRSPNFTLSEGKTGTLSFRMWMTSEQDIDWLNVTVRRASDDVALQAILTDYSATTTGQDCWPVFSYTLAALGGIECYVEFEFTSDDSVEYAGVYLDDVEISEREYNVPVPGDDGIVAFAPNGDIEWVWPAPGGPEVWRNRGSYALSPDESTLYALQSGGVAAGGVWAVNTSDGTTKWHLNTSDPAVAGTPDGTAGDAGDFLSTPVVGADGTLYCMDRNGTMCAIQDNGTSGSIAWAVHQPGGQVSWGYTEGGIGPNGEVLFASDSGGESLVMFQSASSGAPANGAWPRHQRNNGNVGYAAGGDPATSTFISTTEAGALWCGLALTPNGHWVVPSNNGPNFLKAFDENLQLVWDHPLGDWADSGPAVAADGTIYVGSNAGDFLSLTESETAGVWSVTENWNVPMGAPVGSRPAIGPDGTIYVVVNGVSVFALNPGDGSTKWSTPVGGGDSWQMTLAVSADGSTVYFRTKGTEGLLYAIDASDGSVNWTRHVGDSWDGLHPVIGSDGTIYQGATDIGSPIIP